MSFNAKLHLMGIIFGTVIAISAADSVSDWIGRGGVPPGLSLDGEGLVIDGKPLYIFSAKPIPVREDGKYILTGSFKKVKDSKTPAPPLFFGLMLFDGEGRWIHGLNACPVNGTHTILAADVKAGDRVVKVKDAAKWKSFFSVMAFGVKEDFNDLPNKNISSKITNIEKTEDGTWEISLLSPVGKNYPAGTAVRQQSGTPYLYVSAGSPLSDKWQTFQSGTFNGCGIEPGKMWKGTKSVKIVIFSNIGSPVGVRMKDIEFKEIN